MSNIKGKDALAISTNYCYVLADLMETNLLDLESIFKKNNIALKHEQKRYFNAAISNTKKLRREVNHCNDKRKSITGMMQICSTQLYLH